MEKINGQTFAVLENIIPDPQGDGYNLMMVTTNREERQLMMIFSCLNSERSKWKGIAYKMKNSIRVH